MNFKYSVIKKLFKNFLYLNLVNFHIMLQYVSFPSISSKVIIYFFCVYIVLQHKVFNNPIDLFMLAYPLLGAKVQCGLPINMTYFAVMQLIN